MKKSLKDSVLIISVPKNMKRDLLEVLDESMELPQELYEIYWADLLTAMRSRLKALKR